VHAGRCCGGRDAEAHQQGIGNHPEGHAQSAIDDLRGKADGDERQDMNQVEAAQVHCISLPFARKGGDAGHAVCRYILQQR